ncbi:Glucosamine-phosphate N-acetyltransferase-like protein [Scheffersomyces spartinae]|uniref:Glucosamine 6-phosphate N-acetyltransferase n=1 Tax=Scheffersomyces spartinae TaxID=45513 RepID=A0A9P7VB11_9ASCO|nr:Glucosamine-phosphate N-acetyltransferase-like protein [Scheffersomyces spartinae]KAG7194622.1 Glucosamine-phosphate N-acetyltransferase-like protein [Scheffersomyces spartinae]
MELPEGYNFRRVKVTDHNEYLDVLRVLTTVGEINEAQFKELVDHWNSVEGIYYPQVITDTQGKVVATGCLVVERKAIHQCGKVGHIEDIAVCKLQQGKGLGLVLIQGLTAIAEKEGCYKVILDCSDHNVGFYNKCGYTHSGCEMVKRFD